MKKKLPFIFIVIGFIGFVCFVFRAIGRFLRKYDAIRENILAHVKDAICDCIHMCLYGYFPGYPRNTSYQTYYNRSKGRHDR